MGHEAQKGKYFKLPEQMTIHNIEEILQTLNQHIAGNLEIILDASDLELLDTSGLQLIIACAKEAEASNKPFFLINPGEYIQRILKISGAAKLISLRKESSDEPDSCCG